MHQSCLGLPAPLTASYKNWNKHATQIQQEQLNIAISPINKRYQAEKNNEQLKRKCDNLFAFPNIIKLPFN
jgi:hypothetical protein